MEVVPGRTGRVWAYSVTSGRVLLRKRETGLWYAGPDRWVARAVEAREFETIEEGIRCGQEIGSGEGLEVVLLDLNLPQVGGFEVLRWMRNHPDFSRTPVVIFSSSTREDDRVKAREFGANEFVAKPSSGMEFGRVLEGLRGKWMGGRKG